MLLEDKDSPSRAAEKNSHELSGTWTSLALQPPGQGALDVVPWSCAALTSQAAGSQGCPLHSENLRAFHPHLCLWEWSHSSFLDPAHVPFCRPCSSEHRWCSQAQLSPLALMCCCRFCCSLISPVGVRSSGAARRWLC